MGAARMANRTASVYAQRQALLRRGLPLMRLVLKARAVGMAQVRAQRVAKRWAGTERGERAEYRAGNLWDADVRRTDYLDMLGGLGLL
jgi:hypothetical protein